MDIQEIQRRLDLIGVSVSDFIGFANNWLPYLDNDVSLDKCLNVCLEELEMMYDVELDNIKDDVREEVIICEY